jgi:radical SAM family uncharacterized protein
MAVMRPVVLRSIARGLRGARGEKRPVLAGHKLLYRCNLECKMCPFWRRPDEELLGLKDEIRVMKALDRAGVSFLGFEGGEPLLRKDIAPILREANARFHTSLVTNGWLLKQRWREIRPYLDYLFVSLDGIGATHDMLRGIPGSFARAVEGIRTASPDVPMAISSTVTKHNLEEVDGLLDLATELDVRVTFQIAYDYQEADAMSPDTAGLRPTIERLLARKKAGAPILESEQYFQSILGSWYGNTKWRCKPWLTVNVDPSGRLVMPCYVLQEYSGSAAIWDVDVVELWNSFDWSRFESCNKCALACYLEPSLFSWTEPSMLRERVFGGIGSYLRHRARRAWPSRGRPAAKAA